ncbi:MAG: 6-phosphofructokinase, partial [Bdellovibrionaceae bacterium]|nr:6-phosphofructokinase [Pseudobdellovibrionaceae bacterium]
VAGAHSLAGTLLGTSNKSALSGREDEFLEKYAALGLEGLIVAGGDGTFAALSRLGAKMPPLIGVPKTIDNDLAGTEVTFGFDTACSVVAESVDALRATAHAHRRVMVVEAMGRTAGWLALGGGLASYADAILIPERPFSKSRFKEFLQGRQQSGARGLVLVVAEGAFAQGDSARVAFTVAGSPQAERLGGISETVARWVETELGWESRHVILGHLQRARRPTVTDCFLTLAMGVEVSRMVRESAWGQAVVYRSGRVQRAAVSELMQPPRLVSPDHPWVKLAQEMGIFV